MRFFESEDLESAVESLIVPGAQVAIGGQNYLRNPVATCVEIIAQGIADLSLVGCNLSLSADLLVAAKLVSQVCCGTVNLEVFGVPWATRNEIERGNLELLEHDHSSILARLSAARLGLPYVPLPELGENDWSRALVSDRPEEFTRTESPFLKGSNVTVALPLKPDVCILHVTAADEEGNLYIQGPRSFDEELVLASRATLATCEVIQHKSECQRRYGPPSFPALFVDRIIRIEGGGAPTCVPGHYVENAKSIQNYNSQARQGADINTLLATIHDAVA